MFAAMRPEILYPLFAEIGALKGVGPRVAPLLAKLAGPHVRDVAFLAPHSVIHRVPATVASALNKGGMSIRIRRAYDIQSDHQDGFLYCGKHKPERYMDSKVRDNIPAFRDLVEDYELEDGLERMKADIQSGALEQICNSYNRGGGDYMFIKAEKTGVVVEEPEAAPLD